MTGSLRRFLGRNRFLLFVLVSLALTYGWMFIEFGDEMLAEPSMMLYFQLLYEHWYTMLPGLPLILVLSRPPDFF